MSAPGVPRSGAPELERLLEHAPWVRRLARRLVADAASADDLVQDAWTTALEHPPRHDQNLRAWLGHVVRRRAGALARAGDRRRRRERARTEVRGAEATDDVVAAAEACRRVADEVLALGEPYKSVLLLRYYEDLAPRAIAERLGRPTATVKTQLQRGLERLRARLDEGYGTRRAWIAALVPLARAGGRAPLVSVGAAAGSAAWLGAAAALVLVLAPRDAGRDAVTLVVPERSRAEARAADRDEVTSPSSMDSAAARSLADERVPLDVPLTPVADDSTFRFAGRLVDAELQPLPGVRVRWTDPRALAWTDAGETALSGREFWIAIDPAERARLRADERALDAFVAERFPDADWGRARLLGAPTPEFLARSDANGRFELDVPREETGVELVDDGACLWGRLERSGMNGEPTWVVAPAGSIAGRLVDARGAGVAGVELSFGGGAPAATRDPERVVDVVARRSDTWKARTGPDGAFAFPRVAWGRGSGFRARRDGEPSDSGVRLPCTLPLDPALRALVDVRLELPEELEPALVLRGRVLLFDGRPAARALVALGDWGARTDAAGGYAFEVPALALECPRTAFAPTRGALVAVRSGCGFAVDTDVIEWLRSRRGELVVRDLVLPRAAEALEGRLVDAAGLPLAGAQMQLGFAMRPPLARDSLERVARGGGLGAIETDADGRFRIDGLGPWPYALDVRPADERESRVLWHDTPRECLRLVWR